MKLTQPDNSDRDLLLISVFTFFTISLWVFFEIVKTIKTTTVTTHTAEIVVPLSPKIDTTTLDTIEKRKVY